MRNDSISESDRCLVNKAGIYRSLEDVHCKLFEERELSIILKDDFRFNLNLLKIREERIIQLENDNERCYSMISHKDNEISSLKIEIDKLNVKLSSSQGTSDQLLSIQYMSSSQEQDNELESNLEQLSQLKADLVLKTEELTKNVLSEKEYNYKLNYKLIKLSNYASKFKKSHEHYKNMHDIEARNKDVQIDDLEQQMTSLCSINDSIKQNFHLHHNKLDKSLREKDTQISTLKEMINDSRKYNILECIDLKGKISNLKSYLCKTVDDYKARLSCLQFEQETSNSKIQQLLDKLSNQELKFHQNSNSYRIEINSLKNKIEMLDKDLSINEESLRLSKIELNKFLTSEQNRDQFLTQEKFKLQTEFDNKICHLFVENELLLRKICKDRDSYKADISSLQEKLKTANEELNRAITKYSELEKRNEDYLFALNDKPEDSNFEKLAEENLQLRSVIRDMRCNIDHLKTQIPDSNYNSISFPYRNYTDELNDKHFSSLFALVQKLKSLYNSNSTSANTIKCNIPFELEQHVKSIQHQDMNNKYEIECLSSRITQMETLLAKSRLVLPNINYESLQNQYATYKVNNEDEKSKLNILIQDKNAKLLQISKRSEEFYTACLSRNAEVISLRQEIEKLKNFQQNRKQMNTSISQNDLIEIINNLTDKCTFLTREKLLLQEVCHGLRTELQKLNKDMNASSQILSGRLNSSNDIYILPDHSLSTELKGSSNRARTDFIITNSNQFQEKLTPSSSHYSPALVSNNIISKISSNLSLFTPLSSTKLSMLSPLNTTQENFDFPDEEEMRNALYFVENPSQIEVECERDV